MLCPAGEVKLGDSIDVLSLPYPVSEGAADLAQFEYATVVEETERETRTCVVVHTNNGSYGVAPDALLELGPHIPEAANT
ncbi:hypothetical protein E1091_17955 [Micromonospora fluostatini]|uniref:Uncharacterized protein n=1 Tax=Micromonospora fluostatini TaxID=1629071 RepID=A0ABY2DCN0_9ACTN|nr:hypothetical protein E1091_17955 [Micromonospora fluostatini]